MKILINGPKFYNYNNMIARGFKSLGNEVYVSNWPDLAFNFWDNFKVLFLDKINNTNNPNILYNFKKKLILQYNKSLLDQINTLNPDLVFTLKGDILFPETIKYINEKTSSLHAIWCYDSALRYSNVLKSARNYDLFYTFEPSDIPKLKTYVPNPKYLPMAYDPDSYFYLGYQNKTIDICFIGNINSYPGRQKLIEKLILKNKYLNIQIWGKSWTWYNPFLNYEYKIKRRQLGKRINNYNIDSNTINNIYNKSKICINIHHPQSLDGLNPRTFEILGSGGFELVDYKSSLTELLDIGTNIESYNNELELFDKIDYYLENNDELSKISKQGYEAARKYHTYQNRAKTVIEDVEYFR